jgi:thymidylate kinase
VDLLPGLTYRGLPYLDIPLDGPSLERSLGFPVVPDAELALYRMLRSSLWRGSLEPRYGPFLAEACRAQGAYLLSRLSQAVGPRQAAYLLESAAGGPQRPLRRVRRAFLWRAFRRRSLAALRGVLYHLRLLARRFREYPGLLVVLLGADGSGKTSVARGLAELERPFMNVVRFHLFPGWLPLGGRAARTGGAVSAPHAEGNRSLPSSILKMLAWYLEFTLGRAARLLRPLERGELLVFDRYADDLLVDPRRYRYGGPHWLARWVARAAPRPDLCVVLDAPAQTLRARKQEVSFAEARRQRQAYVELAGAQKNGRVVDASRPLAEVVQEVRDLILEVLARRAQQRFEGRRAQPGRGQHHA